MASAADPSLETLAAARQSLRLGVEKSRLLTAALSRTGPRLDEIHQRLPSLESSVRPILARREALISAATNIDRAVGPAAAVLKVFDAVHGLEVQLLSNQILADDLNAYLSLVSRLEEALKFLSDNSNLALSWLEDIVEYLSEHSLADSRFLDTLKSSLNSLKSSSALLDGGLLSASLDKLESEFRRLLSENSSPLPFESESKLSSSTLTPPPLPSVIIDKLSLILDRLIANGRLDSCVNTYVEIRGSNIRASLANLGLDYLDMSSDDALMMEPYIERWGKHIEFVVRNLFDSENKLCADVFDRAPSGVAASCFADVVAQAGMPAFLRFPAAVAECKKDPIKMLKLLDIFSVLHKLRPDFNRLFGGKACVEIQNLTRDLIKRVIEGACEIFWELLVQVELQREMPPPADAGVPRLVSFITDYCNKLLGEEYSPVLKQVLVIHRSWKQEKFQERLLLDAILSIVKAMELNIDQWAKGYDDVAQSHLFLMNTHWHFYRSLKGTKLGELLGEQWLLEQDQYKDFYWTHFMRESWLKLPPLLSKEGLLLFSGGRATARDLLKKRLKAFNETFDDMYLKQSNWVISDRDLREKMCQLVVQTIVPAYRSYMQNYGPLVEQDASSSKYAKYTAQTLEKMLGSLFQYKPTRAQSFRVRHSSMKISSPVTSSYQSAPTVT